MKTSQTPVIPLGCILFLVLMAWFSPAACEEGMWVPYDLPEEVLADMRLMGLELSKDEIFNSSGTGVANAVVSVGATGSFVSPEGLILTNHHVAFGAVQRISTPEKNYIEDGFLARSKEDEIPAFGYRAYIMLSSEDVTERVLSAIDDAMNPLQRKEAIEDETKKIIEEAEAGRAVYCEVNSFFGGTQYLLDTYLRILDVRAVYVPSRAIGEYGGDIDNWMWPRHTGDFSFLRAYVAPDGSPAEFSEDNVPYRPKRYLKIAPEGLADGDFAMIIGFPGKTRRYLTSDALAYFEGFEYPERIRLYKAMLEVLDHHARTDHVAEVKVASWVKGINNRLKNNEGMLDGFRRFRLVEHQEEEERRIYEALGNTRDMFEEYDRTLNGFKSLYDERMNHSRKDLLLHLVLDRGPLLSQAMLLYKWGIEKEKDDMDRDPEFMDRKIPDLLRKIRVFQRGYHEGSDRGILRMFLREIARLPDGQQVGIVAGRLGGKTDSELEEALDAFIDELYTNTSLDNLEERLRIFGLSRDEQLKENDSLLTLAGDLYEENEARIEREKVFDGSLTILMPKWMKVIAEASAGALYSDANGTMRLNFGEAKGYSPSDAVAYKPFTTLKGVVAKNTGIAPFNCPQRLIELAAIDAGGPYVDPVLGGVPVNLLTTHDSTGGNSGSPLLNGKGEIVGCLFDGNYEAMTADFEFRDDITRSISVDIRYVLFVADYVDGAHNVLLELGLK